MMNTQKIAVELTQAEALVLFELLARFSEGKPLAVQHPSERQALRNLYSHLEGAITVTSAADYDKLLSEARVEIQVQE